jgi:hypothetical protein
MNRATLEHIIRASGEIAFVPDIFILGSQAVLGQFPEISQPLSQSEGVDISLREIREQSRRTLCMSFEADIMIPSHEEKAELIEGAIGEWEYLLKNEPREKILALLESTQEEAIRLRSSSPFTGILSEAERMSIFKSYQFFSSTRFGNENKML